MNLEQRERIFKRIQKLEGLLAYAKQQGDQAEVDRIEAELKAIVEGL